MKKGYFYILITAFAFSTMEIAGKMISNQFNPFQLTFLRFFIGSLVLLPFAVMEVKRRNLKLGLNDFLYFALTGITGIVISMSFFQLAILNTKASTVAIIFSTNFVFTIPFAIIILKEKVNKKMLITLLISVLGILLIFNPFSINPDMKGILLAFGAAVTFSLFSVISKTRVQKYGGLILNSFSFLIGNIFLLMCLLSFNIPVISGINSGNILHLLYLGIFVTGIGYLCYFEAMKHTSAITASLVFCIKPALAPLLSFIILHESLSTNTVLGIICIVAASVVAFVFKK
jgi:drug/metabolite transporter (DMT)-like permease